MQASAANTSSQPPASSAGDAKQACDDDDNNNNTLMHEHALGRKRNFRAFSSCSMDLQDTNWTADLPHLPVPELRNTATRYLASLQAVLQPTAALVVLNEARLAATMNALGDDCDCDCDSNDDALSDAKQRQTALLGLAIADDELERLSLQFERTCRTVEEFLRFEGPQLQRDLREHASKCANWATEFWLNDMYLSIRLPLPVNSNPFFLFPQQHFASAEQMLLFAARIIEFSVRYKFKIDQQTLSQDMGSGQGKGKALCMETYKHFFHSYRMPHVERDKLLPQSRRSNHIVVASNNKFYVLYLGDEPLENPYSCDPRSATLPTSSIYVQLANIYQASFCNDANGDKIGLLTTESRSTWALMHKKLTCEMRVDGDTNSGGAVSPQTEAARRQNRASLQQIEDCLFVMCLDSTAQEFASDSHSTCQPSSSSSSSLHHQKHASNLRLKQQLEPKTSVDGFSSHDAQVDAATVILTGGGSRRHSANRWFDKFLQVIVGRNGVCGINVEHSASEGMTVLRFVNEFFDYLTRCRTPRAFGEQQSWSLSSSLDAASAASFSGDQQPTPAAAARQLQWSLSGELRAAIDEAERKMNALVNDFSLTILNFENFGRNFIKAQRVSPDAFVQLALQFTYYKCHGRLVSTYESGSLRQFKFGRVDNIRANSIEALAWIQAMLELETYAEETASTQQPSAAAASHNKRRRRKLAAHLFKVALDKQVQVLRYTINGNGPDNHLLALRELSSARFDALPALFTDESYAEFLRFNLSTSQLANEFGVTVGYGAVLPDGYGCSYNPQRARIVFCVSCFNASVETSGQRFAATLNNCLLAMQQLCAEFNDNE